MAESPFKSVKIYNENDKLVSMMDCETIAEAIREKKPTKGYERLLIMSAVHQYGQELLREGKVKGYSIQMEEQNGETFYCPVL